MRKNLRRHRRRVSPLSGVVHLTTGDLPGRIENIGEGGLFFVTDALDARIEEGEPARVRFHPSGEAEPVELSGQILRVETYFDGAEVLRALAVRFSEPWRSES